MSIAIPSDCVANVPAAVPDFDELFEAQDRHFWFRARNRVLASVVQRLTADLDEGFRVLEIGCGTGNVLCALEQVCSRGPGRGHGRGHVIGLDLHPQGLRLARRRTGCPLVAADIHALPFRDPFEVIGMFDVLEHLPDDRRVLHDLLPALGPQGRLVLTVPAHAWLWSEVDVYSGHYRRYAPRQLSELLQECGYQVEYLTQFMAPLVPLMWLRRCARVTGARATGTGMTADLRGSIRQRALDELKVVPVLNTLLGALLSLERPLIRCGLRLPLGTSLLAVASPNVESPNVERSRSAA